MGLLASAESSPNMVPGATAPYGEDFTSDFTEPAVMKVFFFLFLFEKKTDEAVSGDGFVGYLVYLAAKRGDQKLSSSVG